MEFGRKRADPLSGASECKWLGQGKVPGLHGKNIYQKKKIDSRTILGE